MSTKINVWEDPRFTKSREITGSDGATFTSRSPRRFMVKANHFARDPDFRIEVEIRAGWVTPAGIEVLVPSCLAAAHVRICPETTRFDRLEEVSP
jgi:hypothetical protein